jgi:hypothetical protein
MFRKNLAHKQSNLFGFIEQLTPEMREHIRSSEELLMHEMIFLKIEEEDFRCLYSEDYNRPNAPVNTMLTAIFLKHRRNWTYVELMHNIEFNLLTKIALGLETLDEMPFCEATLFNFQVRLSDHFIQTSENLIERVFDGLTADQLKELHIKADIQRTDSFQAASNIRNYTRMQLLVEMLIRVHRELSDEDKLKYGLMFSRYVKTTSGQFIYKLADTQFEQEFAAIGETYRCVHTEVFPQYEDLDVFRTFERVFAEHFIVVEEKIVLRPKEDIPSGSLQSPDDEDATYRNKRGKAYRGQVVNIVETANPENQLQLITDVAVAPNNLDDSTILESRLETLMEKTPELNELHQDGAFGSKPNDEFCKEKEIVVVQTGIRGRIPSGVPIDIIQANPEGYEVSCPGQGVTAEKLKKRWKAEFALSVCAGCEHVTECQLIQRRKGRVYYFDEAEYLKKKRFKGLEMIPLERRTLRANVEATVSEFVRKTQASKLRVRGAFGAMTFAFSTAISINFGRIFRYMESCQEDDERSAEAEIAFFIEEKLIFASLFLQLAFVRTMCMTIMVHLMFSRYFLMSRGRQQLSFALYDR